jgi:hypothetical protein
LFERDGFGAGVAPGLDAAGFFAAADLRAAAPCPLVLAAGFPVKLLPGGEVFAPLPVAGLLVFPAIGIYIEKRSTEVVAM